MDYVTLKKCITCQEEMALESFYKTPSGRSGRCRSCYIDNQKRYAKPNTARPYVKKGTGFKRLPQEVQDGFKKMLGDGATLTDACNHFNLNTRTVFNWRKSGQLE